MPNRLLREGILTSERVNRLSPLAELFYRRVMSAVDDFGRFEAHPQILLARCYAMQLDRVTVDQVAGWLRECSDGEDPLILVYRVGRKLCLQINEFGQRTRTSSKYPDPISNSESMARSSREHGASSVFDDEPSPRGQAAAHATTPTPTPTPAPAPATPSTSGKTTTPEVSQAPFAVLPVSDVGFRRFIGAFLAAGVKLSEPQVAEAATEWVILPDEEHEPAAAFAEHLARSTEARWMGLPANRLRKREWTAQGPGRLLPPPRAPSKSDDAQQRAAARFKAEKEGRA